MSKHKKQAALPPSLMPVEQSAAALASAREILEQEINELNQRIDELKRERAAKLRAAIRLYNTAREELHNVVQASPALFEKPRTRQLHGFNVGFKKQPGKLVLSFDDARTCQLIRKHFPEQEDLLIRKKESPNVEALSELSAGDLKKIGGTITDTTDKLVISSVETDIDKLVKTLVGDPLLVEGEAA